MTDADDKSLRVLVDGSDIPYPLTGIGTYAWELVSALTETQGIEVTAAFPGAGPEGAAVYRWPGESMLNYGGSSHSRGGSRGSRSTSTMGPSSPCL